MANLSDYLGSLVSNVTSARVLSDIQTVKVAEDYAKHNLLKHFAIPRMRIDSIEMDIPIALDEIEEKTETEFEPIDNTKFNAVVYNKLVAGMGLKKLPLIVSRELKSTIAKHTQTLEQNIRLMKDLTPLKNFSVDLTTKLSELETQYPNLSVGLERNIKSEALPEYLEQSLAEELKITSQRKIINNLRIIGETHKLNEQKPENIIHIKLKISESGVEWNNSENSKGELETRLLPE